MAPSVSVLTGFHCGSFIVYLFLQAQVTLYEVPFQYNSRNSLQPRNSLKFPTLDEE